ncbi:MULTISPECIES: DUF5983 family protein [Serratia]|uniref:DUF5983 family protein n=1 Tax=Serratia TaxID=613 RepID=UPI001020B2ED|nr:DUF5983 family protein [Serratia liquefaciens]RYM75056.1 hypothetical protein BSR00_08465 [Serratia liquefaciens]RYM80510.1 hypothetical protein BSR01_09820 [Serratia liquefaciens]HBL6731589.1 hypothetical protein [Serratia liquefaciens]
MSRYKLPASVLFTGIQCSTAHITNDDNRRLYHASHQQEDYGNGEWCHFTGTGYLIRLHAWRHPVLRLKRLGLSKDCRRLIASLMRQHYITLLHLDAAGDILPEFATFDW